MPRVRWGTNSLELLMCGGSVRSILLLPRVARCIVIIDVCIRRMLFYVCCSDCVGICVCCVAAVVNDSV